MAMAGSRDGSPDYEVGYIAEDHPLRPLNSAAQQSIRLLQVPAKGGPGQRRSRTASISSSVTDLDAPIYERETAGRQHVSSQYISQQCTAVAVQQCMAASAPGVPSGRGEAGEAGGARPVRPLPCPAQPVLVMWMWVGIPRSSRQWPSGRAGVAPDEPRHEQGAGGL